MSQWERNRWNFTKFSRYADWNSEELIYHKDSENEDKILPNEDDYCSIYEEDLDEYVDGDREDFKISRNRTKWRKTFQSTQQRTFRQNTVRVAPGLTAISKTLTRQ